jgi:ribosomal protein S20
MTSIDSSLLTGSVSATSQQNSFATALSGLMSAIKSGNLSSAQSYLTQIEQNATQSTSGSNPLSTFLSSVQSALSNGDISAAQSALTTFQSSAPPAPPSGTDATSDTSGSASLNSDTIKDLAKLFEAIGSGDLTSAKSAYTQLASDLGLSSSSSSSSSSSDATQSTSSSSSSSTSNDFATLLKEIGEAISSGSISGAQTALTDFINGVGPGALVSTSA